MNKLAKTTSLNDGQNLLSSLQEARQLGRKQLAVLVDPDKAKLGQFKRLLKLAERGGIDYFLVGGSLLLNDQTERCIRAIREACSTPILLFPGSPLQITSSADGILLLSLISGRNPELLIGQHVQAAPYLRASGLEIIPTGYILIDGGVATTTAYISNTQPIPAEKTEVTVCTALAGTMLGLQVLYLEAGSGALHPVAEKTIQAVNEAVDIPIIVGGGIRSAQQAQTAWEAGADLIVVGTALEKEPQLLQDLSLVARKVETALQSQG